MFRGPRAHGAHLAALPRIQTYALRWVRAPPGPRTLSDFRSPQRQPAAGAMFYDFHAHFHPNFHYFLLRVMRSVNGTTGGARFHDVQPTTLTSGAGTGAAGAGAGTGAAAGGGAAGSASSSSSASSASAPASSSDSSISTARRKRKSLIVAAMSRPGIWCSGSHLSVGGG
jgi:hypothetical protein